MRISKKNLPRKFTVGRQSDIDLTEVARIMLASDEMVTFVTESSAEYDVVRKDWGFYATPSLNNRLIGKGLAGVLVRNATGRYYVLLVQEHREAAFNSYLRKERLEIVARFGDTSDPNIVVDLRQLSDDSDNLNHHTCLCHSSEFEVLFQYKEPPIGETRLAIKGRDGIDIDYRRVIKRCVACGHCVSEHDLPLENLYDGDYVTATYGGPDGMQSTFDRIVGLGHDRSDNHWRMEWIEQHLPPETEHVGLRKLLDIGSGLGVFLSGMTDRGWYGTGLDPDPRAVQHLVTNVLVEGVVGDFLNDDLHTLERSLGKYYLITLNKVLEHVRSPVEMLKRVRHFLGSDSWCYIEVPDAEGAARDGSEREEFFIEHHHIFSALSINHLIDSAKFRLEALSRTREPSGKYTLRAMLRAKD